MKYLIILISTIILFSCKTEQHTEPVSNYADFKTYIEGYEDFFAHEKASIEEQISFWQSKLDNQPNGYIYAQKLADLHTDKFRLSADPEEFLQANKLLVLANQNAPHKTRKNNYHKLIRNHISLHQFRKAKEICLKMYDTGIADNGTSLMFFDVLMELGEYEKAGNIIERFNGSDSYDYFVRASKYIDYKGNLDSAVTIMEKASAQVLTTNNHSLVAWTNTYLGEMYGHQGRLKKSYEHYLNALQQKPDYEAALKRIAWIALSGDAKPETGFLIINRLKNVKVSDPELLWDLAKMAEINDVSLAKELYLEFYNQTNTSKFKELYQSRIAVLEAKIFNDFEKATTLAKKEISDRPTVQSYDLLAWIYYQKGDLSSALKVCQNHLIGKSSEPKILYHIGSILNASRNKEGNKYLYEALEASFELGPVITREIKNYI